LRLCLQQLPESHQNLIEQRYFKSQPVNTIAETLNRSSGTIKVSLLRIRRQLAECVEKRLVEASNG
ncbi:MAG: sigma factor-like helix-turn-helix DNA-binding protein, partial [Gimesia chilikensis]